MLSLISLENTPAISNKKKSFDVDIFTTSKMLLPVDVC
jgi:hypothetical protein